MNDVAKTNKISENLDQVALQNQPNPYLQTQLNKLMTDQFISDVKQGRRSYDDFYKEIRSLSDEECRGLVYVHNVMYGNSDINIDLDISAYRAILTSEFKKLQFPIEHYNSLVMYKINSHLPEVNLKWLKDDLRSAIFMYYVVSGQEKIKALIGGEDLVNNVVRYFKYEILSFNLKLLLFTLPQWSKEYIVDNTILVGHFESIKAYYLRNRMTPKDIGWLDSNDSVQINWAYEYITDEKRYCIILHDTFFPISDRDKYNLILASLDILDNTRYEGFDFINNDIVVNLKKTESKTLGLSERDRILNTMKNAWDKYSSSNRNESGNEVKINQKNKDKLEALSSADSTSSEKFLNRMIVEIHDKKFKK